VAGPDADVRWIAPGFPSTDAAPPSTAIPVSSLIRQFDAELPPRAPLTILVPPVLGGVDAEPLRLTRKVTWRVIEAGQQTADPPLAPVPELAVRHAADSTALRFFRAAAAAWSDKPRFEAMADETLPAQEAVLVWLIPGPLPQPVTDWVSQGGTALLGENVEVPMPATTAALWRDEIGETLVEGGALGAGRLLRFTRPLAPAAMPELLDPAFAAGLRELISPRAPAPARVTAAAFAPSAGTPPYPLPRRELAPWLGILIALIFLAERLIASHARRFSA
jgi:hypothetical protein